MQRFALMIAASAALYSFATGASRAQAPNDMMRQYGYPFCANLATANTVIHDCGYTTMDQCRATASGMGYCVENPAYLAARANAPSLTPAAAPHKRR